MNEILSHKKKRQHLNTIKRIVVVFFVFICIRFVFTSLHENSMKLSNMIGSINWLLVIASVILYSMFYFFSSIGFRQLLSAGHAISQLTVPKCFGIINISGLTKYIPGKVWSYALMFFVMQKHGVPPSVAVYTSLIHLVLIVTTPLLITAPVLVFSFLTQINVGKQYLIVIIIFFFYLTCLYFMSDIQKYLLILVNKFRKEKIVHLSISRQDIFKTQLLVLFAYLFNILSIMVMVVSISGNLSYSIIDIMKIAIICAFSYIIGFLSIIAPGGIGVQEALIFYLSGAYQNDSAFVIMLIVLFRIIGIICDFVVGILSLWFIREEVLLMLGKEEQAPDKEG